MRVTASSNWWMSEASGLFFWISDLNFSVSLWFPSASNSSLFNRVRRIRGLLEMNNLCIMYLTTFGEWEQESQRMDSAHTHSDAWLYITVVPKLSVRTSWLWCVQVYVLPVDVVHRPPTLNSCWQLSRDIQRGTPLGGCCIVLCKPFTTWVVKLLLCGWSPSGEMGEYKLKPNLNIRLQRDQFFCKQTTYTGIHAL